ncbi:MAG: hypothetical protein ACOYLK_16580 [Sphingomonas sp.]
MCNLYSMTKGQQAILELSRAMRDMTGKLPQLPGIFPDDSALIVRTGSDGVRELAMAPAEPCIRARGQEGRQGCYQRPQYRQPALVARRAVRSTKGQPDYETQARLAVDAAKPALGERSPPWWNDGSPDYNRRLVKATPYTEWYQQMAGSLDALVILPRQGPQRRKTAHQPSGQDPDRASATMSRNHGSASSTRRR